MEIYYQDFKEKFLKSNEIINSLCGSSSVGRALAFQAKGRGFESRLPLNKQILENYL